MKIKISKSSLLRMLNMVSDTITNYSSESSLKEIVIVAGNDNLYVMGKYLDFTITIHTDCNVLEVGTILVETKVFMEVINWVDGDVTVESVPDNLVKISALNTEINIVTKDITTYPSSNKLNK